MPYLVSMIKHLKKVVGVVNERAQISRVNEWSQKSNKFLEPLLPISKYPLSSESTKIREILRVPANCFAISPNNKFLGLMTEFKFGKDTDSSELSNSASKFSDLMKT